MCYRKGSITQFSSIPYSNNKSEWRFFNKENIHLHKRTLKNPQHCRVFTFPPFMAADRETEAALMLMPPLLSHWRSDVLEGFAFSEEKPENVKDREKQSGVKVELLSSDKMVKEFFSAEEGECL